MKTFKTNFNSTIKVLTRSFSQILIGPWKLRSLSLISLLSGYYMASTITNYLLRYLNQRILSVIIMCLIVEIFIRMRNILAEINKILYLTIIDNLRIGITYAVVLEAFKLGS